MTLRDGDDPAARASEETRTRQDGRERDVEGEREQEGWSRRGTVLKKRRCWNRPWKMFNICGVCHFLWLRGRRNRGEGWGGVLRLEVCVSETCQR